MKKCKQYANITKENNLDLTRFNDLTVLKLKFEN